MCYHSQNYKVIKTSPKQSNNIHKSNNFNIFLKCYINTHVTKKEERDKPTNYQIIEHN